VANITSNARAVARKMDFYAELIEDNMDEAVAAVAKSIGHDVVEATPVKSGAAQSAWEGHRNGASGAIDEHSAPKDGVGGTTGRMSSSIGMSAKSAALTNGATYINKLDQGSSTQTPAGFVRAAVMTGLSRATNGVRLLVRGGGRRGYKQ